MVYKGNSWKFLLKWMMTGGSPNFQETPISFSTVVSPCTLIYVSCFAPETKSPASEGRPVLWPVLERHPPFLSKVPTSKWEDLEGSHGVFHKWGYPHDFGNLQIGPPSTVNSCFLAPLLSATLERKWIPKAGIVVRFRSHCCPLKPFFDFANRICHAI